MGSLTKAETELGRHWRRALLLGLVLVVCLPALPAHAATQLYPDLKTLPPRDLRFDRTDVSTDGSGQIHNVLRFSNTVWNAGAGPLELRGTIDPSTKAGAAIQRVYDSSGGFTDYPTGNTFYWHAVHQHYHFDNWGSYQLWTKSNYDAWITSGRQTGNPSDVGVKTTSCVEDEEFIKQLSGTPYPPPFTANGCFPNSQNLMLQGLSPGWGDTYDYYRYQQWIDFDQGSLADGQYVLRSVTDPNNLVYESANKGDSNKEGPTDNEGITTFTVQGGKIVDSDLPNGSVSINGVQANTATPNVTVKVLGRDDVSGVDQFRLSNDGVHWTSPIAYTSSDSTPTSASWNLANATYGGTSADGTKTVYAQTHDRSGKWSATFTDTINLVTGASSAYATAVLADSPVGLWRLGESSGTTASDLTGANSGAYRNSPQLGAPSLLSGEPSNTAVHFNGTNQYMEAPTSTSLSPTSQVSVEAWIKPDALPAAGSFASVVTKPESYSLQFNGPKLEFTIVQGTARRRLQAAAGTIQTGQTYHVVGTYDGTTQRLYVNGSQVASAPLTGAMGTSTGGLDVASWAGQEFLQGTVDEAAVYNSVLSAGRVAAHYSAATGSTPPISAPSSLTATAISTTQVNLSWNDNSSNETEFVVERDTSPSFPSPTLQSTWSNATTFSDTGLTPGTTYYYRVKARNSTDSSGYSNSANATTPATQPPPSGYAGVVGADNPVSWWRFDEASGTTAFDQKGANPGTYLNGPMLGAVGLLTGDPTNKAASFDGSNDYVGFGNGSSLNLSSPLSLETWIKPNALPAAGSFASVLSKPEQYSVQFNGPRLEFTIMQLGVRKRLQAPAGAVVAGQAYHVVATYDGTTQRLYLNGALVASVALSGGATTGSNSLNAASWDGGMEYMNGTIDEPAVYNTALSASRVSAHYTAGRGAAPPLNAPSGLTATAASTSQINLAWTDNSSNESNFVIQRATNSSFTSPTAITVAANATSYQDTGLSASTTYYYRVQATNSSTSSSYSNTANATTQSPPPPPPTGYAAAVAADSPVSYWRLGETSGSSAADQQNKNAGTYLNSPTLGAPSLLGTDTTNKAVTFDGTNDQVRIANSTSLQLSSPVTLEAWIKPTALPAAGSFASLVTKAETYSIQFNGPKLEFTIMQFGVRKRLQAASGAIVAGQTYHVVGTYDGTTQRLYINGVQVASAALTGGATSSSNAVFIGSWDGGQEFFKGTIDEVGIYGSTLSATRVAAHYNAGK